MSYSTFAHLQFLDGEPFSLPPDDAGVLHALDALGLHHDIAQGLANLFQGQEAWFTFYGGSGVLDELLTGISARCPDVAFGVQGRGEELRDVWVREYQGGKVVFEQGPFTE